MFIRIFLRPTPIYYSFSDHSHTDNYHTMEQIHKQINLFCFHAGLVVNDSPKRQVCSPLLPKKKKKINYKYSRAHAYKI